MTEEFVEENQRPARASLPSFTGGSSGSAVPVPPLIIGPIPAPEIHEEQATASMGPVPSEIHEEQSAPRLPLIRDIAEGMRDPSQRTWWAAVSSLTNRRNIQVQLINYAEMVKVFSQFLVFGVFVAGIALTVPGQRSLANKANCDPKLSTVSAILRNELISCGTLVLAFAGSYATKLFLEADNFRVDNPNALPTSMMVLMLATPIPLVMIIVLDTSVYFLLQSLVGLARARFGMPACHSRDGEISIRVLRGGMYTGFGLVALVVVFNLARLFYIPRSRR